MAVKPTPAAPIVAWRARRADGSLGMPVALNPIQALRLSGCLPDPVTLAERDFYGGVHGLGRFAAEHALHGQLAPAPGSTGLGESGELGILPALPAIWASIAPYVAAAGKFVAEAAAAALAAKGVEAALDGIDARHRRDGQYRALLAGAELGIEASETIAAGCPEADLLSGLGASALAGASHPAVGKLGIFGLFRKKKREIVEQAQADEPRAEPRDAGLLQKLQDGTRAAADVVGTAKDLWAIRKNIKKGGGINVGEALKWIRGIVRSARQLLGYDEQTIANHLAAAGETLGALEAIDRRLRVTRQRSGWRPTLGEFGACCCRRAAADDPRLGVLLRGIGEGLFDQTDRRVAAMHAQHALRVPDNAHLSAQQMGELGAAGDFLQALANGAVQIFSDLQRMPVEAAVIEGARTTLNNLVGTAEQIKTLDVRNNALDARTAEIQAAEAELRRRQEATNSLPMQEAINQQLGKMQAMLSQALALKDQTRAELDALRADMDAKRREFAPVAQLVRTAAEKAEAAESARVDDVNRLDAEGLLRGHVMVLSRQEYAELLRRTHEAEAGREKLQQIAANADALRKRDAAALTDANLRIVELKQRIAALEKQSTEEQKAREIAEAIEQNKRELADQLRVAQHGWQAQLERVREQTREAVDRAGDVVNQTGVRMMFDFVRDLTGSMRDIRDVSSTGEFLRLFPQVLEQLRIAQQIASPNPPNVEVNLPAQPAPVVNVAPPEVHVSPPQFVLGPGYELRPADSGSGGAIAPPPVPANVV